MAWEKTKNSFSVDLADALAETSVINTNMFGSFWGKGTPASAKEDSAVHRMMLDYLRNAMRGFGQSGWSAIGPFSFSAGYTANSFHADKSMAFLDGLPIVEVGTNLNDETESEFVLNAPPGSGTRDDLVFIEVFLVEVPGSTTSTPTSVNKPDNDNIYKYGNVLFGGTNIPDDINEVDLEIRRRVQLQYRIRVVDDVDFATFPKGVNDTVEVLAQGSNATPTTIPFAQSSTDSGLFIAGNGTAAHQATLGTLDGFVYALPIAKVARSVGVTEIQVGHVTDLREQWGTTQPTAISAINDFRLIKSGSNLTLERVTGNSINIDGTLYTLGGGLPTLDTTGLSVDTNYYIYLTNGLALQASTTGYTTGTSGRKEKTGDSTQRLVGMARTANPLAWSTNPCLVLSADHRQLKGTSNGLTDDGSASTGSTSFVQLDTANLKVQFLTWPNSRTKLFARGSWEPAATTDASAAIGIDGTTPEQGGCHRDQGGSGESLPLAVEAKRFNLSEGFHEGFLLGKVSSGSTIFGGDTQLTTETNCRIFVEVVG